MKSEIIKIGKQSVVAGMTWDILNDKLPERKAIRKFLKENAGIKYGVVVSSVTHKAIGVIPAGMKKLNAPSGAALLALAHNESNAKANSSYQQSTTSMEENQWLVIEKLDEDKYWIVEIRDGIVIPESDIIGTLEDVQTQIEMAIEDNTSFRVYTTSSEVKAHVPSGITVQPYNAEALFDRVDKPGRADLKTFSGVDPVLVGVVGGIILVGAGYFGWSFYQEATKKEQAALQASQRAKEQAAKLKTEQEKYKQAVEKAILDALDKGVTAVTSSLQTPSPKDVVDSWVTLIENIPFDHSGWQTTDVSCSMETPQKPICEVRLKRTVYGINRILLEDFPQVIIDGDNATYQVRGQDLLLRESNWSALANAEVFNRGLLSDLQFFRHAELNYTQGASKDIVQEVKVPEPPASLLEAARGAKKAIAPTDKLPKPSPVNTGVGKGDLAFSANEVWRLRGMVDVLNIPSVQATNLDLKVQYSQMSWSMKTNFFIRTSVEPTLPTVVTADGNVTVQMPEKYKAIFAGGEASGGVVATSGLVIPTTPSDDSGSVGDGGIPAAVDPNAPPPVQGPISLGLPESDGR